MEKILKIFSSEIKGINEKDFTIDAIISTKKVDRDGDIVEPESFNKRLKTFKEHPVLLSSHSYGDLRKQIGEVSSVKITDTGVEAKLKYYVGLGNPEADWAWILAQKGITAFSIGFIGHAFDWIEEKQSDGSKITTGRKFTDIELLELSQVLIPSNRGALQMSLNKNKVESELCELAIKSFDDNQVAKQIADLAVKNEVIEEKKDHYSEKILGEGNINSNTEPKQDDTAFMVGVIEDTIKNIMKGYKY